MKLPSNMMCNMKSMDVTGFRFKATSESETHSNVAQCWRCTLVPISTFLVWETTEIPPRWKFALWEVLISKYTVATCYFQLPISNFKRTGLDWIVERGDLQDFNISSTPSFCGLDILQLQFDHSRDFSLPSTCMRWPLIPSNGVTGLGNASLRRTLFSGFLQA